MSLSGVEASGFTPVLGISTFALCLLLPEGGPKIAQDGSLQNADSTDPASGLPSWVSCPSGPSPVRDDQIGYNVLPYLLPTAFHQPKHHRRRDLRAEFLTFPFTFKAEIGRPLRDLPLTNALPRTAVHKWNGFNLELRRLPSWAILGAPYGSGNVETCIGL